MSRTKTNQLHRVDVRGKNFIDDQHQADYYHKGEWHTVQLSQTICNYGRHRHWFICPYCHERKAVLYFGGSGLACRKCYRLAYPVENMTKANRAIDGAVKVNDRLKFEGDIDCLGDKPKGMHWKTFRKLVAKRDDYSASFWNGVGVWIGRRFKLN